MIRLILSEKGLQNQNPTPQELELILKDNKFVWIDIEKPETKDFDLLSAPLNLHPLVQEDCIASSQYPKLEEYIDSLALIIKTIRQSSNTLHFSQVNIIFSKNFVLTVHKRPILSILTVEKLYTEKLDFFLKGTDFLVYSIFNRSFLEYLNLLDKFDDKFDVLEDKVFSDPTEKSIEDLFNLKRNLIHLRKTIAPQREIVHMLSRGQLKLIKKDNTLYFRDVFDLLVRVYDLTDTYRDLLTSILDVHLSAISNKMNEIMKTLTIIATIMMPLTLISGIYGMNFKFMPELEHPLGYFAVIGLMAIITVLMLLYFRKQKWI